jgi:type I restriction enzyme S subunit
MRGWSKKCLIDITEKIGSGATPKGGKDAYKESGISLFRSLNVYDGVFKKKNLAFIDEEQARKLSNVIVREGDVLLNITGTSIARCCVAPSELLPARVNQHVAIIRPKPDHIDSYFLGHLLASKQYKDALLHTGEKAGSTRQALTKSQLENFEVTIPPLPEQKRIVAIFLNYSQMKTP